MLNQSFGIRLKPILIIARKSPNFHEITRFLCRHGLFAFSRSPWYTESIKLRIGSISEIGEKEKNRMEKYEILAEKLRDILHAIDALVENGEVLEQYTEGYRASVLKTMVAAECHDIEFFKGKQMLGLMAELGTCGALYSRKAVMDGTIAAELYYAGECQKF